MASLGLALFSSGCGSVKEDAPARDSDAPIAQCGAPATAPLIAIEDVADFYTTVGPCGDVAFKKLDESVWLRRRDGSLEQIAERGRPHAFDVTGRLLSFARDDGGALRTLDGSRPDVTVEGAAFRFGYDALGHASIPFACTTEGVRIVKEGKLRPAIAGTAGLRCGEHGRFGTTLLASSDESLVIVDLAGEKTTPVAGISYRPTGSAGPNLSHNDAVYLSSDGRIALYQDVVERICGDTSCPESGDLRIIRTSDGRLMPTALKADLPRSDVSPDYPALVDRPGMLVRWPRSGGRPFSIDTRSAAVGEYDDMSIVTVTDDGRLLLSERVGREIVLRVSSAGRNDASLVMNVPGQTSMIAGSPQGDRVFYAANDVCVRVPNSTSCNGNGQHGDLVIYGGGKELRRHGGFTYVGTPRFLSDGSALIDATRYVGEPPTEAAMGDLNLEQAVFLVSKSGDLQKIDGLGAPLTGRTVRELSDHEVAVAEYLWDGRKSTSTLKMLDLRDGSVRTVTETTTTIEYVGDDATPSGVLAFTHAKSENASGPRPYVLWHGVP